MEDRDYVLGTHDEEVARLGLQHDVWRPIVLETWTRAGLRPGQRVLDVGCGPGYATLDLAAAVGEAGQVFAIDQSARFLAHLTARAAATGLNNVRTFQHDLSRDTLPAAEVDVAWCRWIFAFVSTPQALLRRVVDAIAPGGAIVVHEYMNYATWRTLPPLAELDEFVAVVMASWRADGGEPDVGASLPAWIEESGLTLESVRPLVYVAAPGEPMWRWPAAFVDVGVERLVALGRITPERATAIRTAMADAAGRRGTRMCTPAVLEIIARKDSRAATSFVP